MSEKRDVFVRNWYKKNDNWPNGIEPTFNAPKHYLKLDVSRDEAIKLCKEYNDNNEAGVLCKRAEFDYSENR